MVMLGRMEPPAPSRRERLLQLHAVERELLAWYKRFVLAWVQLPDSEEKTAHLVAMQERLNELVDESSQLVLEMP